MTRHIGGGFDLRLRIDLQRVDPRQEDQYLIPERRVPISADPWIWNRPDEVAAFMLRDPVSYPMGLRNDFEGLLTDLRKEDIAIYNFSPVCLSISNRTIDDLSKQFGADCFGTAPTEQELLGSGWRFLGFDMACPAVAHKTTDQWSAKFPSCALGGWAGGPLKPSVGLSGNRTPLHGFDIKSACPVFKSTGNDTCSCTTSHFPFIFR
jgi:hypothetical protein